MIHIHPKCSKYSQINDTWYYLSPCKVSPGMHAHAHSQASHTLDYFNLYVTGFTFLLIHLPAQSPASPTQLLPAQGNRSTPSPCTFRWRSSNSLFPHVQNPNAPSHTAMWRCRSMIHSGDTPPKGFLIYGGLNGAPHTAFCCHLHTVPSHPPSSWPILQTGQLNRGVEGGNCFPSTTPFLFYWGKKGFSGCPTASSQKTGKPCMKICPEILPQGQNAHRLPRDGEISMHNSDSLCSSPGCV